MPVIGHATDNGHLSFIYKLSQNDFLRTAADAVHAAHPFHLVGGLECFGHTLLLRHIRNDDCHALIGYIHYEAPVEEQNFSTLIEFINAMEVREDDEEFKNPVDLMFDALEAEKPNHFAVRQYKKYKLAAGVVCSKRLLNQAVGKSLRTHNLKPKKGAQVMRKNEKITALYERLSRDDFGKDDDQQRESNSISNQEILCRGWFLPPNTYDCGSFVVNGTAVIGKE